MICNFLRSLTKAPRFGFSGYVSHREKPDNNDSTPFEFTEENYKEIDKILKKFVSTMNEFFCEWCKCVTKKFKYTSTQQASTAKYKVLR